MSSVREALDNRSPVEAVPLHQLGAPRLTGAAEGFSRVSLAWDQGHAADSDTSQFGVGPAFCAAVGRST